MSNPLYFGPTDESRPWIDYIILNDNRQPLGRQLEHQRSARVIFLDLLAERDGARGLIKVIALTENVTPDTSSNRESVIHIETLLAMPLDDNRREVGLHLEGRLVLNLEVTAERLPAGTLRLWPLSQEVD